MGVEDFFENLNWGVIEENFNKVNGFDTSKYPLENRHLINKIKKSLSRIEKKYDKALELHFFEKQDMKQKDPLIREILRNSVELFNKG